MGELNVKDLLSEVSFLIEAGDIEEAKELASKRDTRSITDSSCHIKWADICDKLDMVDEVILELNLAARDDGSNILVWLRLADIYQDMGNLSKAAKCLQKTIAIDSKDSSYYKRLGSIFEEAKEFEEARKLYEDAFLQTNDAAFKNLIRSLTFLNEPESASGTVANETGNIPADSQIVRFLSLFSGREGVYARQWISHTDTTGYTPIREPMTASVVKNHLIGNHTIGVYQLRIDETVQFIAFDLDLPKYLLSASVTNQRQWEQALKKIHETAIKLVDIAASLDIPAYVEDSGFKGRHVWIFLNSPIPARIAKKFGELFLSKLKGPLHDVQIELFPKQTYIKDGGLGNLIKLPLGVHRRSGKWSKFLNAKGEPYPDQLEFLNKIMQITKDKIFQAVEIIKGDDLQSNFCHEKVRVEVEIEEEKPRASQRAKPVLEYDMERDREVQHLILKCEVLRSLVEHARNKRELSGDERIVLVHTLGFIDKGPLAVNTLLKQCINIDSSNFMGSRLKGNPISCPKIRSRIPNITSQVSCNCVFPEQGTLYPTPVNHLATLQAGGNTVGNSIDAMQFETLLQEYLKVKKTLTELTILLDKYEKQLDSFYEQGGVESMNTPWGSLKRVTDDKGKSSFELKL